MNNNDNVFNSKSEDECDFFITQLISQFKLQRKDLRRASIQDKEDYINKEIKYNLRGQENTFIQKTRSKYLGTKLTNTEIEFITNGEDRFIYWLWFDLLKTDPFDIENIWKRDLDHIERKYLSIRVDSKNEIKDRIIKCIQNCKSTKKEKEDIITEIKERWYEVQYNLKSIKWIHKDDKDQIDFIWDAYDNLYGVLRVRPTSTNAKYHFFIATIDSWYDLESREVFLHRLKKNWNQRKQRRNRDGKVSIQYRVREETKEKLIALAKLNDLLINETLERLIEKAHKEKTILRRIDTNPQFADPLISED
ncbi:hypothetical protein [Photobacterium sp. R1]